MDSQLEEIIIDGIGISKGVAFGKPFFLEDSFFPAALHCLRRGDIKEELSRYRIAVKKSISDLERLIESISKDGPREVIEILWAHLHLLQDPYLTRMVEKKIRQLKVKSEFVMSSVVEDFKKTFLLAKDPQLDERIQDVIDVTKRISRFLSPGNEQEGVTIPDGSIVIADHLVPSDAAEAKTSQLSALVTRCGGMTSHTAIIARAKGIPYVANIDIDLLRKVHIENMIIDGMKGHVIINPSDETRARYRHLSDQETVRNQALQTTVTQQPSVPVRISINIEGPEDVIEARDLFPFSIGLFRTEFLFWHYKRFLNEEEQFEIYKTVMQEAKGLPVVIRVLDVGGEKWNGLTNISRTSREYDEQNPDLGLRGVRFLFQHFSLFKTQLRAILRASAFGDVRILFPMVSSLEEFRKAKHLVLTLQQELIEEGYEIPSRVLLGSMIEVPSLALMAKQIVKEADFVSLGTNDLAQYLLAVDRNNVAVSSYYRPLHPSLLLVIRQVAKAANEENKQLIFCGELGADPRAAKLLVGLGIRDISVSIRALSLLSRAVQDVSLKEAESLARKALRMTTTSEIEALLGIE